MFLRLLLGTWRLGAGGMRQVRLDPGESTRDAIWKSWNLELILVVLSRPTRRGAAEFNRSEHPAGPRYLWSCRLVLGYLGLSQGCFGNILNYFGDILAHLGASLALWGPSWGHLGPEGRRRWLLSMILRICGPKKLVWGSIWVPFSGRFSMRNEVKIGTCF